MEKSYTTKTFGLEFTYICKYVHLYIQTCSTARVSLSAEEGEESDTVGHVSMTEASRERKGARLDLGCV